MKQYIFQKNLTYSSDSLNCNDIKVFNTLKTFKFAKNKTLSSIYSNKIVTFIILNLFVTFLTTQEPINYTTLIMLVDGISMTS